MILELDAGNTRLKWRLVDGNSSHAGRLQGSVAIAGQDLDSLFSDVDGLSATNVQRVRVASVQTAAFNQALANSLANRWDVQPEFARVEQHCAGVINAYPDFSTMGVDRWLAMVAAFNMAAGACCVLDFGSAVTFDAIDNQGLHLGGYIVPGLELMKDSLARKTPALDVGPLEWGASAPGNSTGTAVSSGILAMMLGFAGYCREQAETGKATPQWFLTGGNASALGPLLPWPHKVERDLVLDGLALALP